MVIEELGFNGGDDKGDGGRGGSEYDRAGCLFISRVLGTLSSRLIVAREHFFHEEAPIPAIVDALPRCVIVDHVGRAGLFVVAQCLADCQGIGRACLIELTVEVFPSASSSLGFAAAEMPGQGDLVWGCSGRRCGWPARCEPCACAGHGVASLSLPMSASSADHVAFNGPPMH